MTSITISSLNFSLIEISNNKILLQLDRKQKTKPHNIPFIAEYIFKEQNKLIENIVASEDEILIYVQSNNKQQLLQNLSFVKLNMSKNNLSAISLDVCFEFGLDWELIKQVTKLDKEEIVYQIMSCTLTLANYGFQPGFFYLLGLPKTLHLERRERPRSKVPKGSLAIGGKYIGIYGSESPGGWHIIGNCSHQLNQFGKFELFPSIGQEIRFHRMSKKDYLEKYKIE